jgi:hypothetical protein
VRDGVAVEEWPRRCADVDAPPVAPVDHDVVDGDGPPRLERENERKLVLRIRLSVELEDAIRLGVATHRDVTAGLDAHDLAEHLVREEELATRRPRDPDA